MEATKTKYNKNIQFNNVDSVLQNYKTTTHRFRTNTNKIYKNKNINEFYIIVLFSKF